MESKNITVSIDKSSYGKFNNLWTVYQYPNGSLGMIVRDKKVNGCMQQTIKPYKYNKYKLLNKLKLLWTKFYYTYLYAKITWFQNKIWK